MLRRLLHIHRLFLLVLLVSAVAARADAQVVDTRTGDNAAAVIAGPFGQTFTVPDGAGVLESFSFWVTTNGGPPGFTASFRTYVMRWESGGPTGPVLYQSGVQSATACCSASPATFLTDVPVVAGDVYVAFFEPLAGSLVHLVAQIDGFVVSTYAGGAGVFGFGCIDGNVLACGWATQPSIDREFVATFRAAGANPVPVPEPDGGVLLASGLVLLGLAARRRMA